MIMLFIKSIFLYLLLIAGFGFAQHENNENKNDLKNTIFSFQNSEITAEVFSDSEKLIAKKKMILYLKLSSGFSIDSSSVSLIIKSDNGNNEYVNRLMVYSSGYYKCSVLLMENGSYQFVIGFDHKDSSGNLQKTNFSFNKIIEKTDDMTDNDHGIMGMSSTMMIVMGAAMLVMMAAAFIAGTNH